MKKSKLDEFDPSKIKKIYLDQKEPSTGKFTDDFFPPNDNSFLAKNSSGNFIDPTQEEIIKNI